MGMKWWRPKLFSFNFVLPTALHFGTALCQTSLGIGGWRPKWLYKYSTVKYYVVMYGLFGTTQQSSGSYFVATLSTMEKRFKIPSTVSGLIASCLDLGDFFASLFVAYFGSHGHKTRWLAVGGLLTVFAAFLRYTPHVLFGPGKAVLKQDHNLNSTEPLCQVKFDPEEICDLEHEGLSTTIILSLAHLLLGIGTSSYFTLGIAYLDDNARKSRVPLYLAISTCIMLFGPTFGYMLAWFTLRIFIEPQLEPNFGLDDPRWLGAWWLGWIPLGVAHLLMTLIMFLFPRALPSEGSRRQKSSQSRRLPKKEKSIKDFLASLKRQVKNPILMLNSLSSTFYIFGMMAYWIFLPKYIESQFRKSASEASFVTGSVGLLCTAAGIIVSGVVISYFKPRPTYLAWWNVLTEILDVVGRLSFAFISCIEHDLHGSMGPDGTWNLLEECNSACNCSSRIQYSPVCSPGGKITFYSPCHAGCTSYNIQEDQKVYSNCSCIPDSLTATDGACLVNCDTEFMWFLTLLCVMQFFSATGRAGNTVIQFRSVAPEDKSISIALLEALVCLMAYVPAPIVFGALLDSTCLVWGETCGATGNCWLYHGKSLRYLLNSSASALISVGVLCDIGVALKVKRMKIYDEALIRRNKSGTTERRKADGGN